jgi:phosphatidylglycerophosphatase A
VIGFIIFRILDILKPFPIRTLDKRLAGGIGIVADDVVAGIFANIILRVLLYISDKY